MVACSKIAPTAASGGAQASRVSGRQMVSKIGSTFFGKLVCTALSLLRHSLLLQMQAATTPTYLFVFAD